MLSSVSKAAPHELLPALRVLFPVGTVISDKHFDPSGVFVVRDNSGTIRGAIMGQSMSGALGLVWPPRAEDDELADQLMRAITEWLRTRSVKVCQAYSTPAELPLMVPLERHGFRHITQLVTLRCAIGSEPAQNPLDCDAESPPFTTKCRAVLLSTHERTLDCPELNSGRTEDELLAEFAEMAPGTTWHLARRDELAVGIAILTPGIVRNDVELAYLGVVPGLRGCGFGWDLLTFVRMEAARRGATSLTVSVDDRNWPALQIYRRSGFIEIERREVWLAHLS